MTICQITYLPFFTNDVYEEVDEAIDLIKQYDFEVTVGDLSTTVKGDRQEVLDMLTELYKVMDDRKKQFRLHIELLSSKDYS